MPSTFSLGSESVVDGEATKLLDAIGRMGDTSTPMKCWQCGETSLELRYYLGNALPAEVLCSHCGWFWKRVRS